MFGLSRLAQVSKKHLRLKCSQCSRLLPSEHFPKISGPQHLLVCAACKRMCVGCGVRQSLECFADASSDMCNRCLAKEHVARENVYFRYPTLKYRACPYSADEMRDSLHQESDGRRGK